MAFSGRACGGGPARRGVEASVAEQVVTCAQCRLKYFALDASACPRCSRGSRPSLAPVAPIPASGKMTPTRRDEARNRLLVWRDPPEAVVDRLTSQGVPDDEARAAVAELRREIGRTLAPGVRQKAIVHLSVALVVGAFGGAMLWLSFVGLSAGGRIPVIMVVGGGAAVLAALAMGGRAVVRLVTGAVDNHDD